MGIFSVHTNGEASDTTEGVTPKKIKNGKLAIRAGREIKRKLGNIKLTTREK